MPLWRCALTSKKKKHVQVLQGFLRDCANGRLALDPSEPLYIIELGTGSGKFSFYMLKALEEVRAPRLASARRPQPQPIPS